MIKDEKRQKDLASRMAEFLSDLVLEMQENSIKLDMDEKEEEIHEFLKQKLSYEELLYISTMYCIKSIRNALQESLSDHILELISHLKTNK